MPGHLRVTGDSENVAPAATLLSRSLASDCAMKTMPRMDIVELTLQPGYIKTREAGRRLCFRSILVWCNLWRMCVEADAGSNLVAQDLVRAVSVLIYSCSHF